MAPKKPTLEQILEHASPQAKDAFAYIDKGFAAGIRLETILNGVQSVFEGNDEVIDTSKAYLEAKYPEKEPRSQEDMLEFGDLEDDNDHEGDSDSEFNRLLNEFIKSGMNGEDASEEEIESVVWPGGYRLYCCANNSKAELPVEGVIRRIFPDKEKYLHIDIELPKIKEKGELHITVGLENQKPAMHAWFDKNNIPLFRDGKRLHLASIDVISLLGPDFTVLAGETAYIDIEAYRNDKELGGFMVAIDGPWPDAEIESEQENDDALSDYLGWGNFKARMKDMRTRCEVGAVWEKAGLEKNMPRLHTAIIGHAGTGKTTAMQLMARLYKELGLLESERVNTIRVSTLATSAVNSENEAVEAAVNNAQLFYAKLQYNCLIIN